MRWILWLMLAAAVAGKGKKHRHQKPGRALLDRLTSTAVGEVLVTRDLGLVPPPLDVAPFAVVAANATCGDDGAEEYCRDTPGKRGIICDVCEGPDGPSSRRHPASHAVDGDPSTWWQSPTQAAGDYTNVELIATLPDKMDLLHVIIKSGPSPRPLAWSLEVSSSESSDDWQMIKAFGDKDLCRKLWDLRPERRRRKARSAKRTSRAEKPTCSTQFASPRPLENGEMHVAVGEIQVRRVRILFARAHNTASNQQYYTVRTLTLAARCLCHSHAEHCRVNKQGTKCDCLHGTCGTHCHKCCSGAPWSPHDPCDLNTPTENDLDLGTDFDLEAKLEDVDNSVEKECNCGERGACSYDDVGTILCVNCTENRAGPLCDRCLPGYYSELVDGPCLPCRCNVEGSDGTCKWDRQRHSIQCSCSDNVTGPLCDRCASGMGDFPRCASEREECICDPRGSVGGGRCGEGCQCKANVIGPECSQCASGYFGLSEQLPDGCRPCYCSGLPVPCRLGEPRESEILQIPLGTDWLIADSDLTRTVEPSVDDEGRPYLLSFEVEGWAGFSWRWRGPGPLRLGYGARVQARMYCGVVRGDTGGVPTTGPDVMLVGTDGTILYYGNNSYSTPGDVTLTAPLVEDGWHSGTGPVSRTQLMDVLANLDSVMFRAFHHTDQDEVRLDSVQVQTSPLPLEVCACPPGHAGPHCEQCTHTHIRVNGVCVPCPCHGHASCTSVDGPCGPCEDNTTGPQCERCLPGYYGNPLIGSCKPCACPLREPSNNFSPNCALSGAPGDAHVCTQCPDGYTGDHCELCDTGYFGSPTTVHGSCAPCACSGGPCDPRTGRCVTCDPHREGATCEHCEEGYYLSEADTNVTFKQPCIPCDCNPKGSLVSTCHAARGQCACRAGWRGRACDACDEGYADVSLGCPPCRCGIASRTPRCDSVTGACQCQEGATPPLCDSCQDGYYRLQESGCTGCNCSSIGSESNACDIKTGQCRCKPHVAGRACDTCEEGYWGLHLGYCRPCPCGAGSAACDAHTGACACNVGVGGARCDRCLSGYYGYSVQGCLQCPNCTDGKVCSPVTGRCVCPAHSLGPGCRECTPGHFAGPRGCEPCGCGPGAKYDTCNPHTGQCTCRAGFTGLNCDLCEPGHYGARCKPCNCHPGGTAGPVTCDENGRCVCKENVVGDKCDRCLEGTFGLSEANPSGCTACFCFGRSTSCSQASLARATLHAARPRHLVLLKGTMQADQDSLLAVHSQAPEATITLPFPPVPVYMELDPRFLGDKVTSYGGLLSFTVEQEGGEELDDEVMVNFPLVRLYGRSIVLDYYERIPPTNSTHYIRLHESLWHVRGPRTPGRIPRTPRGALMLALQQLDAIFVRVSTRAPSWHNKAHALLLNVSMDTTVPGLSRSPPALGVEICACPPGYSPPSCHIPAPGFYLPPPIVQVTDVGGTIVIKMEGEAKRCECNGRSDECDPVSGDCLNCTGNTSGPYCESCAPGYHGNPPACRACPCPSRDGNHANSCYITEGIVQCLCQQGYTGHDCSVCAPHHFRAPSGACVPCGCAPGGSLSPACDPRGRCQCRGFAMGDKCELCKDDRSYMEDGVCQACDNCTQTLLDSIQHTNQKLNSLVDTTSLDRIPKPYPALREYQHNLTLLKKSINNYKNNKIDNNLQEMLNNIEAQEHDIFTEANRFKTESLRREKQAEYLSLESMSYLDEVLKQKKKLGEEVGVLEQFSGGERHVSAHRALKEARQLLRKIKEVRLGDYVAGATDVADSANLQSTSIQEFTYRISDIFQRLRSLSSRLELFQTKVEQGARLGERVWGVGDDIEARGGRIRGRVQAVKEVGERCREMLQDITTLNPSNFTTPLSHSLSHSTSLSSFFPSLTAELQVLALAAEEKEGILYNLTPKYREKYIDAVESHVAELAEKANEYKRLFADTRALASTGVLAAHSWASVADNVSVASAMADKAYATAVEAVNIANGKPKLPEVVERSLGKAKELKERGEMALVKARELGKQTDTIGHQLDLVSVSLRGVGWQERELNPPPTANVGPILANAHALADRVFATTRGIYDEASEIMTRIRYQLRRQLAELQRHGDSALGAAEEHVSQIRGNTLRGAEVSSALSDAALARASSHTRARLQLQPALLALKAKVERAKHAAASISVSLTSAPGSACARRYVYSPTSPAVTRLRLRISFQTLDDQPLVIMRDDQDPKKYLSLVVDNKKILLRWNLGSGEGLIKHPDVLKQTHLEADQGLYTISVERVWSTFSLQVEEAGNEPTTATNATSSTSSTFLSTRVWVGGEEGDEGGLKGCLHGLEGEGRGVPLWSFVKQAEGKCAGCTQRSYNPGQSPAASLVRFSGSGYVELHRSGLRPFDRRQFSVSFTFRSDDENALLFMAVDAAENRSISVALEQCRVVLTVRYRAAALRMAAHGAHCGRVTHVRAVRVLPKLNIERGSLRVNGEETLGSPSPPVTSPADLPDLSLSSYWVGGSPPDAPPSRSLRGCLGALSIDREGYDLLDTVQRFGVEQGCMIEQIRSVIIDPPGFLELPAPALRRKSTLGLSFRARGPRGVLLMRPPSKGGNDVDDDDDKHFLSVVMVDGEMEVKANTGKGELTLRSNATRYDDAAAHALRLVRTHKQLELWLDSTLAASGALPGSAYPPLPGGLFVGGLPPDIEGEGYPQLGSFDGTLADLIVDGQVVGLETALRSSSVQLGRAHARSAPAHPDARAHAPNTCAKPSSYTVEAGAVRFGDAPHSRAVLKLSRAPGLAVSLQFRTFTPDGVLLFVPGPKAKPRHYTCVLVRGGRLRLTVRGRRRRELALPVEVAMGGWHTVSIHIARSRISLTCDTSRATSHAVAAARGRKLYIAGFPTRLPRDLPSSIRNLRGFRGCVRRVSLVAGGAVDLSRAAAAGVAQCRADAEPGAYLAGEGYAVWGSWGGAGGEVTLRVRVEGGGALLAGGGGLLLLTGDSAILSRLPLSSNSSVEVSLPNSRSLCDGHFHSLKVRVSSAMLSLTLDDLPEARTSNNLLDDATPLPPGPLYIGGVPEGALAAPDGNVENFKGCIRDVTVAGQKKDWSEMEALHSVMLDSCPAPQ